MIVFSGYESGYMAMVTNVSIYLWDKIFEIRIILANRDIKEYDPFMS